LSLLSKSQVSILKLLSVKLLYMWRRLANTCQLNADTAINWHLQL